MAVPSMALAADGPPDPGSPSPLPPGAVLVLDISADTCEESAELARRFNLEPGEYDLLVQVKRYQTWRQEFTDNELSLDGTVLARPVPYVENAWQVVGGPVTIVGLDHVVAVKNYSGCSAVGKVAFYGGPDLPEPPVEEPTAAPANMAVVHLSDQAGRVPSAVVIPCLTDGVVERANFVGATATEALVQQFLSAHGNTCGSPIGMGNMTNADWAYYDSSAAQTLVDLMERGESITDHWNGIQGAGQVSWTTETHIMFYVFPVDQNWPVQIATGADGAGGQIGWHTHAHQAYELTILSE